MENRTCSEDVCIYAKDFPRRGVGVKEFTELKEGDKLYNLSYVRFDFPPKREWQTVTVKRRRGKTAILKGGYAWGVSENQYGSEWFPSKAEAIENAISDLEYEFEDKEEEYNALKKELSYLRKRLETEAKASGVKTLRAPPTSDDVGIRAGDSL